MLKVAIIGGSGYTGLELLRLLAAHPHAKVVGVSSRQNLGRPVTTVFPSLGGYYDGLVFSGPEEVTGSGADFFFSALPHGASMDVVGEVVGDVVGDVAGAGAKVVDLSADFRLKDAALYKKWYGAHTQPALLEGAVYGLPELHRDSIKDARLVANPGCYPTSALLALAPVVKAGLIDTGSIIIDAKSGVSGAGRGASLDTSFVEVASGFKPYKVGCHRHTPEIDEELGKIAGRAVTVTFTPHLVPTSRGVLSTVYLDLLGAVSAKDLRGVYENLYAVEPFVRFLPEGVFPDVSRVRGSNYCDIGLSIDKARGKLIVVSAIDNLVKGASGQAVQNMNLMSGFDETSGLMQAPLSV